MKKHIKISKDSLSKNKQGIFKYLLVSNYVIFLE